MVYDFFDLVFSPIPAVCNTHQFKQTLLKLGCTVIQSSFFSTPSILSLHRFTSMQKSVFPWLYHTFQGTIRALTPIYGLQRKETGSFRNKIQEKKERSTYCQLFSTLSIKKRIRSLTEAFRNSLSVIGV